MIFLTGLMMAIADSVPGVSGGTIAYILKQYENLFNNLEKLLNRKINKEIIIYFIKFGSGWIIGFISSVLIISDLFKTHIYDISSLFIGLIIASLMIMIMNEKKILQKNKKDIIYTILGFIVVVLLSIFQLKFVPTTSSINNYSFINYIYIFIVSFIAISAMLLPGISGSAIMMIFGVYFPIIYSLKMLFIGNFAYIGIIISVILGIFVGGVSMVKIINKLFKKYKSKITYLILGLLLGSTLSIIIGPKSLYANNDILTLNNINIFYLIFGVGLILLLNKKSS